MIVLDRLFGFLEVQAPSISRQSAHEGFKVGSLAAFIPPLRRYPWHSFLSEGKSIPESQSMKIEPATFRFVT
jgi:hypothetical protein